MAKTRKLDMINIKLHRKENLGLQAFRNRLQQSFAGRVGQVALFGTKARRWKSNPQGGGFQPLAS
jgi:hypothetical protein